jgi:hypothetical protein
MISAARMQLLDEFRVTWGAADPAADTAVNAGDGLNKLRLLAERLVAVQRCFHECGALNGPFSRTDIGSLVNALLRPALPVPKAVRCRLKSQAAFTDPQARNEHDSPISFFRDLLIEHPGMSQQEWMYVLLKYHRVIKITADENGRLTVGNDDRSWKSNRPLDAYGQCRIVLHENSRAALETYTAWVNEQIEAMR